MEKRPPRRDTVDAVLASLPPLPEPLARPVLIVLSGLPGTGKSHFSRQLAQRIPLVILGSDSIRKLLFAPPTYSASESTTLFRITHEAIERLLDHGIPVLLDATNLVEAHRERLYHIADHASARLILVSVRAPAGITRERLAKRLQQPTREDHSDADWPVYQRMSVSADPIGRNHYVVDTSRDIGPVIAKIARDVDRWVRSV